MCAHLRSAIVIVFCLLATIAFAQTKPVVVLMATGGTMALKIDPIQARAGAGDFG